MARFVRREIEAHGGIRRAATIADQAQYNFELLTSGGWPEFRRALEALHRGPANRADERATARMLADQLAGLGPKQSRNTLQILGLTRFETPIDSRITKWLSDFGFPVPVSAGALSDPGVYELVEDGFQALCKAIDVYPTMMDAAIFASFDGDGWDDVHRR